jgi:gas vesicle protein
LKTDPMPVGLRSETVHNRTDTCAEHRYDLLWIRLIKTFSFFSERNLGLLQPYSGGRGYISPRSLDSIKGDNIMKPDTQNEIASNGHDRTSKCNESLSSRADTDLVQQRNGPNRFATFVVGAGIGALVALLFAPASGKKTRSYIARTAKQGLDDAASTGKRWSRRAQDTMHDVKANVVGVVEAGQKAYRTARDA